MGVVYCLKCKYHFKKSGENEVSTNFIDGKPFIVDGKEMWTPGAVLPTEGRASIIMCQQESCFGMVEEKVTPMKASRMVNTRLRGQAQLNGKNDCKFYEEKDLKTRIIHLFKNAIL